MSPKPQTFRRISADERRAIIRKRTRGHGPHQRYTVLLLKAIRDDAVHDWNTLKVFQAAHDLRFIDSGSSMVGEAPAVIRLLENLEEAGLVIIEGMKLHDIWVRTDNFSLSPPGRVVFENGCDPDHRLDHPDAISPSVLRITVSPHWENIQNTLGISLRWLADLQDPRARIVVPDVFPEPRQSVSYSDVFVAMPFDKALKPVYKHIVKACDKLSLTVSRGDDFFTAHAVMADVWAAMQHARVIVADCTTRNPNVFYEIGMAHVLATPVVLVSQRDEDIPFDLHNIRRIAYQSTRHGMTIFESALEATLSTVLGRPDVRGT